MRRLFTQNQRRILVWIAGGHCHQCGNQLSNGFHADHIKSFAKGGKTITQNGQALCPACNLKKAEK